MNADYTDKTSRLPDAAGIDQNLAPVSRLHGFAEIPQRMQSVDTIDVHVLNRSITDSD
jgi:hypothetical protein